MSWRPSFGPAGTPAAGGKVPQADSASRVAGREQVRPRGVEGGGGDGGGAAELALRATSGAEVPSVAAAAIAASSVKANTSNNDESDV
jgi:hypothetical protein